MGNMVIVKGDDKDLQVVLQRKPVTTGILEPFDLTGHTVVAKFKAGTLQTVPCTIIDAKLGKATFNIAHDISDNIPAGMFSFDILATTDDEAALNTTWKFINVIEVKEKIK